MASSGELRIKRQRYRELESSLLNIMEKLKNVPEELDEAHNNLLKYFSINDTTISNNQILTSSDTISRCIQKLRNHIDMIEEIIRELNIRIQISEEREQDLDDKN